MAKFVDKDPFVYEQEKSGFLQSLQQFHAARGFPFKRKPTVDAKELDLYLMYLKVTGLGGFQKITDNGQWEDLLEFFDLPRNCSHAANALRQSYIKYLEPYEKIHFLGEDEEDRGDQSGTRPSTPVTYHRGYRGSSGICTDQPNISEYDKLQYSLLSGLPNEIDFAINVCTLLSNEGRHVLHLVKAPRLIDLLLAHTGVFFEGPGSIRTLYEESWKTNVNRDFVKFWYDTVNDDEVREIIGPESFKPSDQRQFKDPQLFCQRKLGLLDIEGQRVLQVAIILKNLSFEMANRPLMAAHRTLYRFLLLCIHNSCSMLRQISMDTLSNLADEFVLDSVAYRSTQLMFHTIYKGLEDDDRFIVLRSLEVVEKLLEVENNIDVLEQCLEHRVFETVIKLLHVHDIQLLLEALELLLVMSEKGGSFCCSICKVDRSIDVLVCLVTLDAQSLGADAFVGIKIIDPNPEAQHHPPQMSGVPRTSLHHAPTPPPQPPVQVTPGVKSPGRVQGTPTVVPPPSSSTPPATPTSTKDAEAERFACQWLNCHVEANKEQSIGRVELYAEYIAACKQTKGVSLPSNNFARCVRLVYPHVGMKKVDTGSSVQYHIAGIAKRKHPLPFKWQPQEPLTSVLSSSARPASTMMAHLASRHSPSPNVSPSPPPPTPATARNISYTSGSGTPNQRAPPPPYHPSQVPGYTHSFPQSSPQVMNGPISRTGYPPGQQMPPPPPNSSPTVVAPPPPRLSSQQHPNSMPTTNLPRSQPQQTHLQHSQAQPIHGAMNVVHSGPRQQLPGSHNYAAGPQGPMRGPQVSYSGPQVALSAPPGRPQLMPGVPQVQLGGQQMTLQRPPAQWTGSPSQYRGPHSVLSSGPNSVNPIGPQNVPPNSGAIKQTFNPHAGDGNIVLQRAPDHNPSVSEPQNKQPLSPPLLPTPAAAASTYAPPQTEQSLKVSITTTTATASIPQQSPPTSISEEHARAAPIPSAGCTAAVGGGDEGTASATSADIAESPQPPIPPPTNPMVDALSPSGICTPCPADSPVSTKSLTESEAPSVVTEGGESSAPSTSQSGNAADLLEGEVRIQKVPNSHVDETDKQEKSMDASVPSSESPPLRDSEPVSQSNQHKEDSSILDESMPSAVSCPLPPIEAKFTTSGNKITVSIPSHPQAAPSVSTPSHPQAAPSVPIPPHPSAASSVPIPPQAPPSVPTPPHPSAAPSVRPPTTKSITLVHTNPVVHQVVPASGATIQNVLVPSQGIVLNVQPMIQGQVQLAPGINLQPKQSSRQPVNIQPKPIQPKPATFNQSGQNVQPKQNTMTTLPKTSVNIHMPSTQTISIQPSATLLHQGQPMMTLQHHPGMQTQQIVLGQSFVMRPPVNQPAQQQIVHNSTGGSHFVANIQNRLPLSQGSAMVVATSAAQNANGGFQQGARSAPLVSYGCTTGTSQSLNTDAPLIKRLLQQNSPISPPRQVATQGPVSQPQMQLVQSQGHLVAVNAWTTQPPQQQKQGLINIAPRPMPGQPPPQQQHHHHHHQHHQPPPYNPQLMVSVPNQNQGVAQPQLSVGPVQYNNNNQDQCSPGDLASPTSSTSSTSKSKKKKSKDKHRASGKKKKSKKHSKRSHSPPACSRDSNADSVISESVSEANPSECSQDSLDHPIVVPQTPDINNPLNTHFTGTIPPAKEVDTNITCNGEEVPPESPPKAPKKPKAKSPKPTKEEQTTTPNKVLNGIGEEVMIPVEAKIERIENPNHIENQKDRSRERVDTASSGPELVGGDDATIDLNKTAASVNSISEHCQSDVISGKPGHQVNDIVLNNVHSQDDRSEVPDLIGDKVSEIGSYELNKKQSAVVNHIMNGQMTKDILQKELNAAIEDKVKNEIVKSITRMENRKSNNQIVIEDSFRENKKLKSDNAGKDLCLRVEDGKLLAGGNTNGPIKVMENGDIALPMEKNFLSNGLLEDKNPEISTCDVNHAVATPNGHTEICPDVLSPNTSISSSPIGSPLPSDTSRTVGSHLPPVQVPSSPLGKESFTSDQQRGMKRTADDIARCDTPSSLGSGPLSPPPPPPAASEPKKSSSKKRRSSSTSSSSSKRERRSSGKHSDKNKSHQSGTNPISAFFICEWHGCHKNLSSAKSLHVHACKEHVMTPSYKGTCEWEGCDNIKRQRWSTVTHIQEKHCSEDALLMAAERRTQRGPENQGKKEAQPPTHPVVYNAHTAYHAIRRSLHAPALHELMGEKEGPVTRSIRITSSLILKNIAKYSDEGGRRLILRYEDRLSHVALSKAESASTIAKCLWFLHQDENR